MLISPAVPSLRPSGYKYCIVPESSRNPFSRTVVPAFTNGTEGGNKERAIADLTASKDSPRSISLKRRIEETVMPNCKCDQARVRVMIFTIPTLILTLILALGLRVRGMEECREEVTWGYRDAGLKHEMLVEAGWTPLAQHLVKTNVEVPFSS